MPNSRDMLYLTYEELKPNILICTYFYLLKIFFLLYLTYEELKLINSFCYLGKLWPPVVPYLWGIETHSRVTLADLIVDSCTLPMRNWNNVSSHFSISCKRNKMLYLTYEELKRKHKFLLRAFNRCTLPMRNWNISQLKYTFNIIISSFVVPYLWGIETHILVRFNKLEHSCTLPMRNWNLNFLSRHDDLIVIIVVPYLWGIETIPMQFYLQKILPRCTLPMRNWNSKYFNNFFWGFPSCTLPMRNWNDLYPPLYSIGGRCLVVPYLWGIETFLTWFYLLTDTTETLYLTYEELKLCIFVGFAIIFLSC